MQRFVPIGASRLQFTQAVIHDPTAVEPVLRQLQELRPSHVLLDRTEEEWEQWQRDSSYLEPFETAVYDRLAFTHDVAPYAVPKAVHRWCIHNHVPMGLMLRRHPPPPKRAVRTLRKDLEVHPAGRAKAEYIVADLYQDHVLHIPDLKTWLQERHAATASALVKTYAARKERPVCIFAYPEMDPVAQQVQWQVKAQAKR